MALTDSQKDTIREILGVPAASPWNVAQLAGLYGSVAETYDLTRVIAELNTKLNGVTTEEELRAEALIARWIAIGATSQLRVTAAGTTRGVLVDAPAERDAIRAALANAIGFSVPAGGFAAEMERRMRRPGEITR